MVELCAKANEDRHISTCIGHDICCLLGRRGMSWTKSDAYVMPKIMKICMQILHFGVANNYHLYLFTCPRLLACMLSCV